MHRKSSSISDINAVHDKFIQMTAEGHASDNILNIYFSLDYCKDQKWLLNVREDMTMQDLSKEVTKVLHHEFEEFKELSSLKVGQIVHKDTGVPLENHGEVRDHLKEEDEIICKVTSYDIWLNLCIEFKIDPSKAEQDLKCAKANVKIKIENNCSCRMFKGICQKLAFVIWNKYCCEKNPQPPEKSLERSSKDLTPKRSGSELFDKMILTPTRFKSPSWGKRRMSSDALTLKFQTKRLSNNENMVHIDDHDIQSIIEEDDKHHEELKCDLTYDKLNNKPGSINNINIPKFTILKCFDEKQEADKKTKRETLVHKEEEFSDDSNICEVFHNDDHALVRLEFTPLNEALMSQKSCRLRSPPKPPSIQQCNISVDVSQHERRSHLDLSNTEIFDHSTERDTKLRKTQNGFFGNIIVPMARDDEMEFLCRPMNHPHENSIDQFQSFEEYVEENENQKTKNLLTVVSSLFSSKKKRPSQKAPPSLQFINSIEVCDNVLSRRELNAIHIPLVKDFWFIEVEEFKPKRRTKRSFGSNKSSVLEDLKGQGCMRCTIF